MSLGPRNVTPRSRGAADSLDEASNKAKMALQHVFSSRGLQPWNASSERAIDVVHSVRMGQHPEGARPLVYHSFASASKFFATHRQPALLVHSSSPFSQERSLRAWMRSLVLRIAIKTSIGSDVSHDFRRAVLS